MQLLGAPQHTALVDLAEAVVAVATDLTVKHPIRDVGRSAAHVADELIRDLSTNELHAATSALGPDSEGTLGDLLHELAELVLTAFGAHLK